MKLSAINLSEYYTQKAPADSASQQPDWSGQAPVVLHIQNGSFSFDNPRSREGLDDATSGEVVDFKLDNVNVSIRKVNIFDLVPFSSKYIYYFGTGRAGVPQWAIGRWKVCLLVGSVSQTTTCRWHNICCNPRER